MYSVPLLAPLLAARLGVKRGRVFVVTANRAGLRQSFVEDGRLRFARLERTVEMVPQALAMFVRTETHRLAQYLVTLRALPREGAPIQVLVVAPPGERAAFEQALTSDARLEFRTIDAAQARRAAGVKRTPEGTGAEALYLHLASKKPPREQFASRDERRSYVVWQRQRGIVAAGALGFAACVLYAGAEGLDMLAVRGRPTFSSRAQRAAERTSALPHFPRDETAPRTSGRRRQLTRIGDANASLKARSCSLRGRASFPVRARRSISASAGPTARTSRRRAPAPVVAAVPGAKPEAQSDVACGARLLGRVKATDRNYYRGITGSAALRRCAVQLGLPAVRTSSIRHHL